MQAAEDEDLPLRKTSEGTTGYLYISPEARVLGQSPTHHQHQRKGRWAHINKAAVVRRIKNDLSQEWLQAAHHHLYLG